MSIEILPARLANQIAAGEVVERPASVIKELVENSLDAGATSVKIQIEKGGAKRIKITDNGSGIPKDELTLALSRHATSKIKTLNDLEGICSLGFRGEALASISSVSRLTLTSKPKEQESAWQAVAEGRDMQVEINPAAHPNGTSIDVQDLFFNTPARRKFLRTDKTEFTHIEEVVKRIALARLDVTFILIHNDKIIRQYRAANTKAQYSKRVAQICGQKFIEHAIEVECEHNDLHFSGWLAKPSFVRNQNDLCYSYVNGRMMKDKLINHAIRQSYENLLPPDTYPAFVLFLTLNHRDVDVNVHPAKHEVRFHQSRYVHDFIFSVCQKALSETLEYTGESEHVFPKDEQSINEDPHGLSPTYVTSTQGQGDAALTNEDGLNNPSIAKQYANQDYIKPLTQVNERSTPSYSGGANNRYTGTNISVKESNAYHELMSNQHEQQATIPKNDLIKVIPNDIDETVKVLHLISPLLALISLNNELRLLSLTKLHIAIATEELSQRWEQGFVGQPLLLPVKLSMEPEQVKLIEANRGYLEHLGFIVTVLDKSHVQIRQFPSLLRHKDVVNSFNQFITAVMDVAVMDAEKYEKLNKEQWLSSFCALMPSDNYSFEEAMSQLNKARNLNSIGFEQTLLLNSVVIDLTSEVTQLMSQ